MLMQSHHHMSRNLWLFHKTPLHFSTLVPFLMKTNLAFLICFGRQIWLEISHKIRQFENIVHILQYYTCKAFTAYKICPQVPPTWPRKQNRMSCEKSLYKSSTLTLLKQPRNQQTWKSSWEIPSSSSFRKDLTIHDSVKKSVKTDYWNLSD